MKNLKFRTPYFMKKWFVLLVNQWVKVSLVLDDWQRKDLKVGEEWKLETNVLSWLVDIIIHSNNIFLKLFFWLLGRVYFMGFYWTN